MVEACSQWGDPGTRPEAQLSWLPIDQVRDVAEEDIHALIVRMGIVNEERTSETPDTPPYHRAARELGRLAALVREAAGAEERMAGDVELRRQRARHGDAARGWGRGRGGSSSVPGLGRPVPPMPRAGDDGPS